jgi:IS5 family transposase
MYKEKSTDQLDFQGFVLPFGGHLDENNRWVILSKRVPWDQLEEEYSKQFSDDHGAPAKAFRMAFGSLIIKEKLMISDEETVAQIRENPYLQYFVGMGSFTDDAPFSPSMMVHFRKRISADLLEKSNEILVKDFFENDLKKKPYLRRIVKKKERKQMKGN